MFADGGRAHIRGGPELSLPIGRLTRASLLVPLFERLIGQHENAALAIKPSVFVDIFHWRHCSVGHGQNFVVAIRHLFFQGR